MREKFDCASTQLAALHSDHARGAGAGAHALVPEPGSTGSPGARLPQDCAAGRRTLMQETRLPTYQTVTLTDTWTLRLLVRERATIILSTTQPTTSHHSHATAHLLRLQQEWCKTQRNAAKGQTGPRSKVEVAPGSGRGDRSAGKERLPTRSSRLGRE